MRNKKDDITIKTVVHAINKFTKTFENFKEFCRCVSDNMYHLSLEEREYIGMKMSDFADLLASEYDEFNYYNPYYRDNDYYN